MKRKVLVVDDEFLIRMSLENGLTDLGYQVSTAQSLQEGLEGLARLQPDVLLLDNRLGDERGLDAVGRFRSLDEDLLIIMMTAYGSVSQAVEAMKLGASHYVQKPFDLEEIDLIIGREMENLARRRRLELMSQRSRKLIGASPAIEQLRREIEVLAENDMVDLLVCGETGTGKEVVVNSIHDRSARKKMPLVKINCGAIPESLLESELFGYEKGAFTGAVGSKKGLLELGNGGTVFLDEIGELPLAMQAKLLTFLEDRSFKRVGGLRDLEVDVRVCAATNRSLEDEVAKGTFREDLYYRLNVLQISIPPLRRRREDIPVLCRFYLEHFNRKFNKTLTGIDPDFLQELTGREWRGNVRELRNVMERGVLFSRGELLTAQDSGVAPLQHPPVGAQAGGFALKELTGAGIDLRREVEQLEGAYIQRAMELTGGNLTRAAQLLGLNRFALKRRLEQDEGTPPPQ